MVGILSITGTFVLLAAAFIFAIWKDIRPFFQPEHMYAIVINPDRSRTSYFLKPNSGAFLIKFGKTDTKYSIDQRCVYTTGRFNTGTLYYLRGISAPVNFSTMKTENEITASDFHEATESHVARDIIKSTEEQFLSPLIIMLIICLVVVVSAGFVYFKLSGPISDIQEQVAPEVKPVPISNR